uniref:Uncharacterized protein n=1 Tax=Arundo donax TaxID=35708 RepID=A0A0A9DB22_ARUDO
MHPLGPSSWRRVRSRTLRCRRDWYLGGRGS